LPCFSLQYTDKAVVSARAARKKRWICFFIILIVLIVIAVVVAVVVINNNKNKPGKFMFVSPCGDLLIALFSSVKKDAPL